MNTYNINEYIILIYVKCIMLNKLDESSITTLDQLL